MKIKNLVALTILIALFSIITGCSSASNQNSSADWAYSFVVWNGNIYKVGDEYAEAVDKEIGEVTKYLDMEGTYSGNFSNKYAKGTKYFSIKDIGTDEAIAVKEQDGTYRKAINQGKYGERK
ncbi:hypothetical protein [Oceanobacillus massiliensis]|uniref:hypothetical protein n=1 Tax=Oceanobacillus massiliensis TaxID=1465765 RepID=UPI000289029B|nr:hypothetical protein [Oceanobacillus massiliensis]